MNPDKTLYVRINKIAESTVNAKRAERNLIELIKKTPEFRNLTRNLTFIAQLFASSQFLSNYCIAYPEELESALEERKTDLTRRLLRGRAKRELVLDNSTDVETFIKAIRLFKKRYLLRITIRYVTGETDITASMDELTYLAEVVISAALQCSLLLNQRRYGELRNNTISIIALGKLGGEELNYSSDVDLIAVYKTEEGETSGIPNPSGIIFNRISSQEFYAKVVELFNRLLSTQSEDGIAYRVDMRLRPQGQRGSLAMPLRAYRTYYESWGRTWERMALMRARPVAGDRVLGEKFLAAIEPFVWRRTNDYAEIEEIRALKKKIDSTFTQDDIKRGYGGIREVEFFIKTFQALYASENSALKTYRIMNAIQTLKWMDIVPRKDLTVLLDNYLFLRCLEQYLQLKEDLQTHTLPSSEEEMHTLSREMNFSSVDDFRTALKIRRMQIKAMYNSLLGTYDDIHAEALNLLEGKVNDTELSGYLAFRNVKYPDTCLRNIRRIQEHMASLRTIQERSILRSIVPQCMESALISESPDRSLAGLEKLFTVFGIKTVHMTALKEQPELMDGIIRIFSLSPYLTQIFLSSQRYLDILIEEWSILKSLKKKEQRLGREIERRSDFASVLADFRRFEEVRVGMLFLLGILTDEDLFRELSYLAEAIIRATVERSGSRDLAVIGLGKCGGREMTFGSDLDIVFVSSSSRAAVSAEKIVKSLTAYTSTGPAYAVDTRLRPDGSKGVLVKDIAGYDNYYHDKAQGWEIQALLKARPLGGNEELAAHFMHMAKEVILEKGRDVQREEIRKMRDKIMHEMEANTRDGDIKLGPGGIEEIEFYTQYLQLHYAKEFSEILIQNTRSALNRLERCRILTLEEKRILMNSYVYYMKLQTFLRLNEERVIVQDSDISELSYRFMGHDSEMNFWTHLTEVREKVLAVTNK